MCFFFSLIPATVWAIIGFFVLFASTKSEGRLRKFAQILAIWSFIIAALFPLGGAYATLAGLCQIGGHDGTDAHAAAITFSGRYKTK